MESNFYSDEFEHLIREKTEQYKMYPSEKVWKGVHSSLHTKRKWFITGMFLLVTGTLFMAGKELITPNHAGPSRKIAAVNPSTANPSKTSETSDESPSASTFAAFRSIAAPSATGRHSENEELSDDDPSSANQSYKGLNITISDPVISQPDISEYLSKAVRLPAEAPALPMNARMAVRAENTNPEDRSAEDKSAQDIAGATDNTAAQDSKEAGKEYAEAGNGARGDSRATRVAKNGLSVSRTVEGPDVNGGPLKDPAGTAAKNSPLNTLSEALDQQRTNWLQEYALNNLQPSSERGRKLWQLYLAPTVEYRSLSGGYLNIAKGVVPPSLINPVSHNTAYGLEAGGALEYRVTRNLTIKAGVQFNFSRYTINAYVPDQQQGNKVLNSYIGYYQDSLFDMATIRNFKGEKELTLNNDYYQLSAPVGFDLRVLGNERLQFHIGASIQPTYLLYTNAYVISPDHDTYKESSSFPKSASPFRKWNFDGGLEAFLTYRVRSITWQVGPELRYQLLSSYNSQYLIGENMRQLGFKIGIVKAFR